MSSISSWMPSLVKPLGERAALVDSSMRHVPVAALDHRAVHRRPAVVAGEGELTLGHSHPQKRLGVALVEPGDASTQQRSHRRLVHPYLLSYARTRTFTLVERSF
jgi:hypothetical protein